ncbi:RING finger protein nhl-1 isoform X2 [Folsomia candida]|uniref:RING finger protein nhl-1 isoform X2 n=1 Tax=Folsomia candida TaxID=158441 RepID=UPI000B8F96F8|nr:RING finger protein nhl-1 isoform X2 [Folsomia candida]
MDQFDQLLTCAICLDRYRNPKLLPCQHSFCVECLEGLVDYVRKQIKCPECRAEHRVGYQGVAGFPTNVTLQRFLELHIDLTGELPDPFSNQVMERCQICSEKQYLNTCSHCDKKICGDCKDAHVDVLKREIQRINNQVKRVLNRLEDAICTIDKNTMHLQTNSISVIEEIEDIYRRLSKALKDRAEHLKHEVERYLGNELKQLSSFRANLEQEVANIQSNCDLVEKYMVNEHGTQMTWQDNELMDTKDVFLRTMEFIRNFEYEPGDYARRIKFSMNVDPNKSAMDLGTFADVYIPPVSQPLNFLNNPNQSGLGSQLSPGQGSALMRSKSDHRLTTQYRNMQDDDESGSGSYGSGSGRKFGDPRHPRTYGQDGEDGTGGDRKSRFRSRFTRHLESSFEEPEPPQGRGVRFEQPVKERERVLDTDDASKGPMSGITRLFDNTKVIERIADTERPKKPAPIPVVPPVVQKVTTATTPTPPAPWRSTSRQLSEDDEITKQKKLNKEAASRVDQAASATRRQPSNEPKSLSHAAEAEHHSELPSSQSAAQTAQETSQSRVRKLSPDRLFPKKRSESEDSGSTSESATSSNSVGTEEKKNRLLSKSEGAAAGAGSAAAQRKDSTSSTNGTSRPSAGSRFANRYLSTPPEKKVEPSKEEDEEEESSEEESSESESEEEESDSSPPAPPVLKKTEPVKPLSKMEKTDIGPILARSANARDKERGESASSTGTSASSYTSRAARRPTDEPTSPTTTTAASSALSSYRRNRVTSPPVRETEAPSSRYGTSSSSSGGTTTSSSTAGMGSSRYPSSYTSSGNSDYTTPLARSRTGTSLYSTPSSTTEDSSSRYSSGLASKYLNRSRHTFDADDHPTPSASRYETSPPSNNNENESSKASRLSNLKDRRAKINRSKSSHDVLLTGLDFNKEDEDNGGPESPTSKNSYANYQRRKSTTGPVDSDYKVPSTDESSSSLSSWARYLKNKYGKDRQQPSQTQRSPEVARVEELPKFNFSTNPYMNKKKMVLKFGTRGSEAGCFTWPRGIACGLDGQIVVADSSNHRVQVFGEDGSFIKEFGQYGNCEGEFDCLAGVAVNRIGQFIVSDRYNHRIQVFDPSGRFLRAFGSQGSTDGKFNYPWGVATCPLGFIYVCDKENHRVSVFQSDGTFVGRFGSIGSKVGELQNPHYVAVTSTNKVIVSDTNNNRLSVWDVNGRFLNCIGEEGSGDGQFKLPRGLAIDDSGVIVVGDSGNNRIVILSPDGPDGWKFMKTFGSYGVGNGEFKGIEGVAVTTKKNILVCDRENHRIQIF